MVTSEMVLPTQSLPMWTTPPAVLIPATSRCCFMAYDHSLYVIAPSVFLTACDVPSFPWADVPTPPLNVLPAPLVQAPPEAACRYCWKLSLVPDASLR